MLSVPIHTDILKKRVPKLVTQLLSTPFSISLNEGGNVGPLNCVGYCNQFIFGIKTLFWMQNFFGLELQLVFAYTT